MKKRLLSILLAALMLLTLVPTVALAVGPEYPVYVNGNAITDTNRDDVFEDGGSVKFTPGGAGTNDKLTLNGANLTKINYIGDATLDIEVFGENTVIPTTSTEILNGILTWKDNGSGEALNPNASLNIYGDGSLTVDLSKITGATRNNGIFVNNELNIKGITLTVITGNPTDNNHGIHAEKDIIIDGAKVYAEVGSSVKNTTKPICAYKNLIIKNGAEVTAVASKSDLDASIAIFAGDTVEISGEKTKVNATAGKGTHSFGILASKAVTISGGTITAQAGETSGTKAAIAATADYKTFGKLTVGAKNNIAKISGAKDIIIGTGKIAKGYIKQSAADPVEISFGVRESMVALLAVAVSTTIAVRSITSAAKLVIGVPMALGILSRLVFRWF